MNRAITAVLSAFLFLACSGVNPDTSSGREGSGEAFDVVILGGDIVDGTGNASFPGDLGIHNDEITAITPPGLLANAEAELRIDATGMVVSPGFIDIQSHSRSSFVGDGDGRVVSKVTMGVTTEIMGESNTNGPSSSAMMEAAGDAAGVTVFKTFGDWMRAMETHGASVNVGSFVGATTIRVLGKGEAMGNADEEELALMQDAVRESMKDGAFGIASALIYPPGNFASTEELIAINQAAAPYGGVYITHLRSEADYFLEAIDEAITIGTTSGVPIEIYHLKAGGRRNWSKASQAVAKIDSARAAGVDIQANMYPYTAGGTGLTACFPPWASADGKLFDNLADSDTRMRIRAEIENQTTEWENLCTLSTPEGVLLLGFNKPDNQRYSGRYLSDISEELGKDWIDTAFDLVLDERQRLGTIYFMMSEENVAMQIGQSWMKFGTDAGGIDPETAQGLTHPRAYGTFTRILGKYVREEGATTLEEAIRKMSSAVATRLHIKNRGLLKEGFFADIVIFDPSTVSDHATYDEPHQLSTGVHYVLVNGVPVVSQGEHTDQMPGRPVYGPGWTGWDR